MADSTLWDGILMGIKSKAAPVTVALSQSVCQPLSTLDQLCVCVLFSNVMLMFDSAESWRVVSVLGPSKQQNRQSSWYFKADPGGGSVFPDSLSDRGREGGEATCHWATRTLNKC